MARPKTGMKPKTVTKRGATCETTPSGGSSSAVWPEVLTLAEAAAYLRVPEAELERIAGTRGLPGRRIGSEWRFSRAAIQDWLRRPSMKESLLRLAGSWKEDPYLNEMLDEIYQRRGRPMTERGQ